jgi:radical SAM protein with 4Fe4S-binding SPASM domain
VRALPRPDLDAPAKLFDRLASEVLPHADDLAFGCRHEALLHPALPEHVARLAAARDALGTGTNLCLLTPGAPLDAELSARLVASRIDTILLSVDATDEATYATMRPPARWPDVRRRIEDLAGLVRNGKPAIGAQALLLRLTLPHLLRTLEDLSSLGVRAFQVTQVVWGPLTLADQGLLLRDPDGPRILDEVRRVEARARDLGVEIEVPEVAPDPLPGEVFPMMAEGRVWDEHLLKATRRSICVAPWYKLRIDSLGYAYPCFRMTHPRYAWGNLLVQSFAEIVNGERAVRTRALLLEGKAPWEICERCAFGPVTSGWADRKV